MWHDVSFIHSYSEHDPFMNSFLWVIQFWLLSHICDNSFFICVRCFNSFICSTRMWMRTYCICYMPFYCICYTPLHKCEMSQSCVSQVYISYSCPTCWAYTWHYPDTLMNYRIDIRTIPMYVNICRKSEHIPNYVCVHLYFNLERDVKVYMFDT